MILEEVQDKAGTRGGYRTQTLSLQGPESKYFLIFCTLDTSPASPGSSPDEGIGNFSNESVEKCAGGVSKHRGELPPGVLFALK